MDKYIKNAAIYLAIKNEKEDNYFISNKIEKIKQCCKREDMKINHIFVNYDNGQNCKDLREKLKKEKIDVLIINNDEKINEIDDIEIEKVII